MKQTIATAATVALLLALAGCGGGGAAVSEEDAKQAFVFSFGSVMIASIANAFGEELEGVSLNEEGDELTLDGFDFAGYMDADPDEMVYTSVSGTIANVDERMEANLTLEGGPVSAIEFSLGAEEIQASEGFSTTITVNGREIELDITTEDMQG